MESCALLLAERRETWVGEGVVEMEVVDTLAVADAVDCGSHCEMGGEGMDNWQWTVEGEGCLRGRTVELQWLMVVDEAKTEDEWPLMENKRWFNRGEITHHSCWEKWPPDVNKFSGLTVTGGSGRQECRQRVR